MIFSYEEARNFINEASGRGSVLGLDNMKSLMSALGNPQDEISVIHIAGTNGKGSVGAFLASICKESKIVAGRYCSPAVFDPLECFQYNGRNVTKEEYANYLSQVKSACDIVAEKGIFPTVFEIETALAFVYFKAMQVDVLLLETGLGGETDATNVVASPLACVFTTISRDHMQFLGESLEEIATVKAGIIKPEARVFSATQETIVQSVIENQFYKKNFKLLMEQPDNEIVKEKRVIFTDESMLKPISQTPGNLTFSYKGETYSTKLSGLYQMRNAALAIEVASLFPKAKVKEGIEKAYWPGRFEVICQEPLLIIDGAHNEDAVQQLVKTLENCFTNTKLDLIIGILADKEHEKMLEDMLQFADQVFTITPPNPRGLSGETLAKEVRQWHEDVEYCCSIDLALKKALAHGREAGRPILAFGSLSYLGELKRCLIEKR